jgi:ketosteroid isomerase-like protein/pimeloyl-ACP methyl ester carboxylesterase
VLLQGSGAARRPFGVWAYFLARHGIATLVYDKRGAGASTGDWQTASFEDLAGDALAAVNLLRKHPNINAQQIGLWGNSNSGWVVPIVAARSKDVAFVISRVGSALQPHENILFEIENDARQRGFTEQEIKRAVALRKMYHQAIITNTGWEQLRAEVERSRNERWFEAARMGRFLTIQIPPDAASLTGLRNPFVFDPVPFWERVTCPVLALYGEMDMNVPTTRSVPILDAALKRAGNKDYTITILPNANHGLAEVPAVSSSEPPRVRKYVSGYMDGIADWLLKRVSVSSRPSGMKERIAQLNREMENAFNQDEMLKVSAFYADDAEIIGDNLSIKGRKEIDKYWLDLKGKGKSWKLQIVEIGGRDDMLYQLGVSDLVAVFNGKEQKFVTNFIVLWKLQKDGSYKIYRDFITKAGFLKS